MGVRLATKIPRHGALLAALLLACTAPLRAQNVKGLVVDSSSHEPIKGADVVLLAAKGEMAEVVSRALTGPDGRFALEIPKRGAYAVAVEALGYATYRSHFFTVDTSQMASLRVDLQARPIALKGLSVTTTALGNELTNVGFYRREKEGLGGYFLTAKQIRARTASGHIVDAFYGLAGVNVKPVAGSGGFLRDITMRDADAEWFTARAQGSPCYPTIYLNGNIIRLGGASPGNAANAGEWTTLVNPDDVAGIEVYTSLAGTPAVAQGTNSPCGTVLIWTSTH